MMILGNDEQKLVFIDGKAFICPKSETVEVISTKTNIHNLNVLKQIVEKSKKFRGTRHKKADTEELVHFACDVLYLINSIDFKTLYKED